MYLGYKNIRKKDIEVIDNSKDEIFKFDNRIK